MLSVCGSVYRDGYFPGYVRSILDRASDPDHIEFVVVEDEAGSDVMARAFEQARVLTKRLTVIPVGRQERAEYMWDCVNFYEREAIFPADSVEEFKRRLDRYVSGELARLWFAPARNYNLAISASSGDVIVNTPMDLLCHFDLSTAYRTFKEDLAQREHLSVFFGMKGANESWYHGLRIFNRELFEALKRGDARFQATRRPPGPPLVHKFSFDERWFARCFYDDDWNERALLAGGEARGWLEKFGEQALFSMPDSSWQPEYLSRGMMLADHDLYVHHIRKYLSRREAA